MGHKYRHNQVKSKETVGNSWTVSSWVTNITNIKWDPYLPITAKIRNKRWVFFIYFCLWLSVRVGACCPLTFYLVPSNNVNASLVPILARQSYSRLNILRLQFFRAFSVVFNCGSLFNEAAYVSALRRLRSPLWQSLTPTRNNQRQKYMKNLLLLRTSAGISRYGPRLMIVMIFVTQITFQTVQEFPTISLDFTSQSLNDKIRNKRWFFPPYIFVFVPSWRHGLQTANEADEVLLGQWPR